MAGRHRRRRRRLRRALWSTGIAVAILGGLVTAVLIFVGGLVATFDENVQRLAAEDSFPAEVDRPAPHLNGAQNILLIASDARGPLPPLGDTEVAGSGRSDVLMLVHIAADRRTVHVISILRDSWVEIPGHGPAKVNAAFAWGGAPLAVATVEQLLGARIDHVAVVGFEGFQRMTDALGGVTVPVTEAFEVDGRQYRVGDTHLDGRHALDFVRERYAFVDGDYQRVRNQQAFLGALARKAIDSGTFAEPAKISSLVNAASSSLSLDETFTSQNAFELGVSLRQLRSDDIRFLAVPTTGTGLEGDQSVVRVDVDALEHLKSALAADALDAAVGPSP